MIDDFRLEQLVEPLQKWFQKNARVLPWRESPKAYYVWISEIMLQQTRVEAVKPYFDRFIRELPDVKALAECPEDKLLKLWEGLGYYNRVRNLKIAANQIMDDYNGEIPSEYEELLKLKGIGSYTAGAISSIAFGNAVPAVDGNVLRVISRVTADDSDIMKQSVRKHMEEKLYELMNKNHIEVSQSKALKSDLSNSKQEDVAFEQNNLQEKHHMVIPSIFNQALMELGATVCVPNGAPHCEECPWGELCEARKQDRIGELPVKKKAKARRLEEKTVLIIKDGEQIALHKRENEGLLAGLYELPNINGYLTEPEILEYIRKQGYEPVRIQPTCDAKHIFSHVEWHMKGYAVFLQAKEYVDMEAESSFCKKTRAVSNNKDSILESDCELYQENLWLNKENSFFKEEVSTFKAKRIEPDEFKKEDWIFVEVEDTKEKYAIPSAFSKYAKYLNLVLGKDAVKKHNGQS